MTSPVHTAAVSALILAFASPTFAQQAQAQAETRAEAGAPIEIIQTADTALTCPQIAETAAQLSQEMGGAPGGGLFGALGGVARAGAAMVIPGAGLVTAAADALTRPDRERKEAAALAVKHRWYYLNGLYAGLRCQAQAEAQTSATPATPSETAPPSPQN
jgi:hypothetical protein